MQNDVRVATSSAFMEGRSRSYVLVVLTLIFVVNYIDRQIVGLLLPSIKAEFGLSDTAMGLLSGTAFVIFYGLSGLPLAVLADRLNRRNIIAISLAVFSVMTTLSAFATQFWHLLVARLGTGIGEAGTSPASNSMISDLYPPERRASALAFYFSGLNIGLLIAYFAGGWIAERYGWRAAFLAAGIPGLVLLLVLITTVREPARGRINEAAASQGHASLLDTTRHLLSKPAVKWLALGGAIQSFGGYANVYFMPSFFFNSHHLSTTQIGIAMALMSGVGGAVGTYYAGQLADRHGARDVRWQMYIPTIAILCAVPFSVTVLMASDLKVVFVAGTLAWMTSAAYLGPSTSLVQGMCPPHMRAQSVALLFFFYNMIALGLGPLTAGFVSDSLKPMFGDESLRYALLISPLSSLIACVCWLCAARTLKESLR